jgi:nucleotide-binding universal stress UspA family protein
MRTASRPVESTARIAFKSILYLTDFSEPSQAALTFATTIARRYDATIHALHVLIPEPMTYATSETMALAMDAQEEFAKTEMQRLESELAGVVHETSIVRAFSVCDAVKEATKNCAADMIVLGTHGRTGTRKLLLGSVAEDIFRRSNIPVLTIGPAARRGMHNGGRFRCVLFATDFTTHSLAALPYAISLAEENQASLILFHVVREWERHGPDSAVVSVIGDATRELRNLIPPDAEQWCRPVPILGYGEPADRILQAAGESKVDLIVLGVRDTSGDFGASTHLSHAVAHQVVAHALCPVLTVRGRT